MASATKLYATHSMSKQREKITEITILVDLCFISKEKKTVTRGFKLLFLSHIDVVVTLRLAEK